MEKSLETLAGEIQSGHNELMPELWERSRKFIILQAKRYFNQSLNRCGVEEDDLIQQGYFALCDAVKTYDHLKGMGFLGWLDFHLKREFRCAAGLIRHIDENGKQYVSPSILDQASSLDRPLYDDDPDSDSLASLVIDERAAAAIDEVEQRIYNEELHEALDSVIDTLSSEDEHLIRSLYYNGESVRSYADRTGIESIRKIYTQRNNALDNMRKITRTKPEGKKLREMVDEQTNFYLKVSPAVFNTTHESAIEKIILKRERIRKTLQKQKTDSTA